MHAYRKQAAFSLVELAIVLVILGLLAGGVLSGQSLIRAAELRAVSTEYDRYITASQTFRDKYMSIPGDMPNATAFWDKQAGAARDGRDATCAALTHTTPSTDKKTCNGDGNGRIDGIAGNEVYERYRLWQHLANAGLIEGSYTGVQGPAGAYDTVAGSNTPLSKTSHASWSFIWNDAGSGDANSFAHDSGNFAEVRGDTAGGNYALLTPEEAWNIDTKLDDGAPGKGRVTTYNTGIQANCSFDSTGAAYKLLYTSKACSLIFASGL